MLPDEQQKIKTRKAKQALDRLAQLPGMAEVKSQVEQIIQFSKVSKLRAQQGLKTHAQSNHMVFTGNPGTGKTTAARLIGEAFANLGLLKSSAEDPPFIEIHHADVTHPHVGQAEKTIKAKFREARGGVIFIDEAYAFLAVESSHNSGEKVVAAIVQLMEDMRDEVMVIAAGYKEDMNEFLDSNPGLRSRFSSTVHFSDYEVSDLLAIAASMCKEREYQASREFVSLLGHRLQVEKHKPGFGNGRTVRNIVEHCIRLQSVRVAKMTSPIRSDLALLTAVDIEMPTADVTSERDRLELELNRIQMRLRELDLRSFLYGL